VSIDFTRLANSKLQASSSTSCTELQRVKLIVKTTSISACESTTLYVIDCRTIDRINPNAARQSLVTAGVTAAAGWPAIGGHN
jgi:hypothetical protein